MYDEIKVLIQWSNGSMLPVLTKKSSKASDLLKLLRFACSSKEEIKLRFNGILLNPEMTLESQSINDNAILNAAIIPKSPIKSQQLDKKIQSVILEAAKIADRQHNLLNKCQYRYKQIDNSSSDNDYYEFFAYKDKKSKKIASDPLPTFWGKEDTETPNLLDVDISPNIQSVEEAGKFLEKKGWSEWIW